MAEEPTPSPTNSETGGTRTISWTIAAILAILALVAGVWLGRVAFVSSDTPAPRIVNIEVEDPNLEVGGSVEYLEDDEVYILTINTMPPPEEGEVFMVWAQRDDIIVPAGVLSPESRTFAFSAYSGRYEQLFVTAEPAPYGEGQPTNDELITVDLMELEKADD